MAVDFKSPAEPTTTELVAGILTDAQDLIKQQFELLKVEVKEDLRKTRDASLFIGAGVLVGLVGLIHLTLMLVYCLYWATDQQLPLWACYGISGGAAVLIAGALAYAGINKFSNFNPLPDETAQALKENVQWITQPK